MAEPAVENIPVPPPGGLLPGMPEVAPQGYWDLVWKQFKKNRPAAISGIIIILLFLLACWAPVLASGKPWLWTQNGRTSCPLLDALTAPTEKMSVDYLFNYLFFLSLTLPLVLLPTRAWLRRRQMPGRSRRRFWRYALLASFLLAALPFLSPGWGERQATPEEAQAKPGQTQMREFHLLRGWNLELNARDYLSEAAELDTGRGDRAIFTLLPQDPLRLTGKILQKPGREHLLGTDSQGRDVLARMIHGARISMSVGFVSVGIAVLLGIFIGGLAGYYRGWVDIAVSRLIELFICFPTFFLIITIIACIEERSIFHIMVVMGLTGWTGVARLIRGEFLKLAEVDFVHSARALGCSNARVMFRHILPNALGPVLVSAAFGVAGAVLTESGLSYLGFGAPPPTPTWGEMISQGKTYLEEAWWLMFFPGLSIFLTVTVYNLVGDGLRDAMDPKLRK
jgi:peptide/nickel transport system permease protein